MSTIHIKGFAERINICDALSNNYNFSVDLPFDEDGEDTIQNVFLRFYQSDKECPLEDAVKGHLKKMFGSLEVEGSEYGYSEYTIEGFDIHKATMGGHNIQEIIDSKKGKYLHILIDIVK